MSYEIKIVTPPAVEPLLVGGANKALDITHHLHPAAGEEPEYLKLLITTARRFCENATSRAFIHQTLDIGFLGGFPSSCVQYKFHPQEIRLPRAPLAAWDAAICSLKYLDTAGVQQALVKDTDFDFVRFGDLGLLVPVYSDSWPATRNHPTGGKLPVEARLVFGYGASGTDVPETYRIAMALLVGHWFNNREAADAGLGGQLDSIPLGMEDLLAQDAFHPY